MFSKTGYQLFNVEGGERKNGNTMKTFKLLLIAILLITTGIAKAQDVIVKKDNSTILSKVTRISETEIEYKKWSNLDGPTYTLNIAEIVSINYQNGEIEYFSNKPESPTNNQVTTDQQSETINQKTDVPNNGLMKRSGKYLTLDGRVLSDNEVLELVGYENYKTYLDARRQYSVGKSMLTVYIIIQGIYVSTILINMITDTMADSKLDGYDIAQTILIGGAIDAVISLVTIPIMCFNLGPGKRRLDWVANEYNKQHYNSMSFTVAPSLLKCEMPQLQNNYGLGLTFSMKF